MTARRCKLTRGSDEVQSPRFSPDGGPIAFLSDRKLPPPEDEKSRRIREEPGDATNSGNPHRWRRGRRSRDWTAMCGVRLGRTMTASSSPHRIALAVEQERKEIKERRSSSMTEKRTPPVRLFSLNIEDGTLTHLTATRLDRFARSSPGRKVGSGHGAAESFVRIR